MFFSLLDQQSPLSNTLSHWKVAWGDPRGPCFLLREPRAGTDIHSPKRNSPGSDLILVFPRLFFWSGHFYSRRNSLNIFTLLVFPEVEETPPGKSEYLHEAWWLHFFYESNPLSWKKWLSYDRKCKSIYMDSYLCVDQVGKWTYKHSLGRANTRIFVFIK